MAETFRTSKIAKYIDKEMTSLHALDRVVEDMKEKLGADHSAVIEFHTELQIRYQQVRELCREFGIKKIPVLQSVIEERRKKEQSQKDLAVIMVEHIRQETNAELSDEQVEAIAKKIQADPNWKTFTTTIVGAICQEQQT